MKEPCMTCGREFYRTTASDQFCSSLCERVHTHKLRVIQEPLRQERENKVVKAGVSLTPIVDAVRGIDASSPKLYEAARAMGDKHYHEKQQREAKEPKPNPQQWSRDQNVYDLRSMLLQRSRVGVEKYGTTTDRQDIDLKGWLQHALEEALDQCVYLRAAIRRLEEQEAAQPEAPQP